MDKFEELKKRLENKIHEIGILERKDFISYIDFSSKNNFLDALEWVLDQIDELMEGEE